MTNKKAILLVRVSTDRQDFDEQEQQLFNLAVADGFAERDIIAICEKESGIKLKEEDRRGLTRMKEVIDSEPVSCVYCWEVSRIGRKKKVIFSITEYLATRGIQLIVKEPYIKLLNEDGSINDAAETVLTLYAQIAESEMRNKQSRWQRTRVANSRDGIWNGGPAVRYGYTLDEKNRYIVNEPEAEVIRLIYSLYTAENAAGQHTIRKDLEKRGIFLSQSRIQRILKFAGYCGRVVRPVLSYKDTDGNWKQKPGNEIKYPAIITEQQFDLAQQKKTTANKDAYKGTNYYFAKSLMKCPVCGHSYIGYKNLGLYMCVAHKHDNKDIVKCENTTQININVLDTLLWDAASSEYIIYRSEDSDAARRTAEASIDECQSIIEGTANRRAKIDEKRKRTALIYADEMITEEEYRKRMSRLSDEISTVESDRMAAEQRIAQIRDMLSKKEDRSFVDVLTDIAEESFSINELREMFNIVHTFINSVEIQKSTFRNKKCLYIKVSATSGRVYEYKARYECGGRHRHIYYRRRPGVVSSFEDYVEINPSVLVKRPLGRAAAGDSSVSIVKNDRDYYENWVSTDLKC